MPTTALPKLTAGSKLPHTVPNLTLQANVRNYYAQFEESQIQQSMDLKMREYEAKSREQLMSGGPMGRPGPPMLPPPGLLGMGMGKLACCRGRVRVALRGGEGY